jgi:O-antigen ligase
MDIGLTRPRLPAATLLAAAGLAALAAIVGALAVVQPLVVVGPLGAALLVALAFLAPVTHLTLLLFMTAVVGFELQRRYAGQLLPSDALLLTGLLRAVVVMLGQRIERRRLVVVGLMLAFMVAVLLQLLHGLRMGNDPRYAAAEARILLSFGTLLVAVPIVADPLGRVRLARGLVVVGLLLGLWGLAQWSLGIKGSNNINLGVRTSADFAVSGHGQLHGGLYGYPVAVVMASAALFSGLCRSWWPRLVLVAVVATNLACLLLTYERTFWLMTVIAVGFCIAKLGRGRRFRAAMASLAAAVILLGALAVAAPKDFTAIRDRGLSVRQGSTDTSYRWRAVETKHLLAMKIEPRPLFGWGLGNFVYWGKPWLQVPPSSTWFAHNGYLWMVWKTGIFIAALLFALLAAAIFQRGPPEGGPSMRAFRTGAQAGLAVLLLSSLSFPSFNSLAITAVMGTLMAVCFAPLAPRRRGARVRASEALFRSPVSLRGS